MSKKIKKTNQVLSNVSNTTLETQVPAKPSINEDNLIGKILSGYIPYIVFMVMALALYSNTFKFQYALDD